MFIDTVKSLIVGMATLFLACGVANAAPIPVSEIDPLDIVIDVANGDDGEARSPAGLDPTAAIDDYYVVEIISGSAIRVEMEFASPPPSAPPTGFSLELFEIDSEGGGIVNTGASEGLSLTGILEIGGLAPGRYLLNIGRAVAGFDGYTARISAVPLPPALLIFVTGLFGMGLLSRYRRRRKGQLGLMAS